MHTYDFQSIERKWQKFWGGNRTFRALNPGDPGFDASQPKFYVLDMFPYPSGAGLHVGHPVGYIATDIVARYKRMTGHNVLHPMGYDAFGLPAEQYAVETGTHPKVTTDANVETYRRQLKNLALSVDWDRELATIDPEYYRWTQWIFLKLFDTWYDARADKGRPIAELNAGLEADEIRAAGSRLLRPADEGFDTAPMWSTLDAGAKRKTIDGRRLAYVDEVPVNWCPQLGTVLANEEVTADGRSERGNFPVFRRPLKQWMLRITAYAERLLDDLDTVDWSEALKLMQRNWIGKSEGARVRFTVAEGPDIEVFTTRPDTLFGATYMVLAPEHELVDRLTTEAQRTVVDDYRKQAAAKSEMDRQTDTRTKDGVFTGAFAVNPVNGEQIPIWIADYVLMGYGTGAIMAVPGHDDRDFAFAKAFDLPIVPVVEPPQEWFEEQRANGNAPDAADVQAAYAENPGAFAEAFTGEGVALNSENPEVSLNGTVTGAAKRTITEWLNAKGLGEAEVQYKLRDWLFSRQRYWGEPFPILHGPDGELIAVEESELPVELPPLDDFRPRGSDDPNAPPSPALSRAADEWKTVERDGVAYHRELNTMPQWAGSCWYYLRYLDPKNDERFVSPEAEAYWMSPGGADLYVGGVEHAVLHLLYARFWHKVLFDLGHLTTAEPFQRLVNQGYILAYAYQDERGMYVSADDVVEGPGGNFTFEGKPVTRSSGKMGKSLKNSVTPDDLFEQLGCDTFRLYEMYMGPFEQSKVWNTKAIVGVHRFLQRMWRNVVDEDTGALLVEESAPDDDLLRLLHRTIHEATKDMEEMGFNTAIARLIELNNALVARKTVPRAVAEALVLMVAPMAPHIAEELWQRLGHDGSLAREPWPAADPKYLVSDEVEIVVQVMGKKRATVTLPADADEKAVSAAALADPGVQRHIEGKTIRKVIHVPGKLVNIVAN